MNLDALGTLDAAQILNWLQPALWKLVAALATLFIGRWVAARIADLLRRAMRRAAFDPTLTGFLGNAAYGLLLALVLISALGQLGVNTTSAAALLGGAGIAIGLSLKDQLSAFAAGAMLIVFRPFKVGDFVDAGGVTGTVEAIRIVVTVLRTPNNQEVMVPNDRVWGSVITNFSSRETRRIDLQIGIAYDSDLKTARELAARIVAADARVLGEPAPWTGITELGDSAIVLTVRPWVKTADFWQTRADLIEAIKTAFDEGGITIAFPQLDVHLTQPA